MKSQTKFLNLVQYLNPICSSHAACVPFSTTPLVFLHCSLSLYFYSLFLLSKLSLTKTLVTTTKNSFYIYIYLYISIYISQRKRPCLAGDHLTQDNPHPLQISLRIKSLISSPSYKPFSLKLEFETLTE